MAKIKGAIVVNTERCKGCQLCIVACPKDVIALADIMIINDSDLESFQSKVKKELEALR